jgi:hypothetical protein
MEVTARSLQARADMDVIRRLKDDPTDTSDFQVLYGKALEPPDQSVAVGFHLADYTAGDLDLKCLHGPEFDAPLDRARQNVAGQRAE